MLDIYFACSIRGGRGDADTYARMVDHIKTTDTVLSEIFADGKLTAQGSSGTSEDIYQKDMAWVQQADAIIAEVSNPSLGVGYEIAKAEEYGKPILALYRNQEDKRLSAMIDGSPYIQLQKYDELSEATVAISAFLQLVRSRTED